MEQEIGHFESCDGVNNLLGLPEDAATLPETSTSDGGRGPTRSARDHVTPGCTFIRESRQAGTNGPVACPAGTRTAVHYASSRTRICFPKGTRTAYNGTRDSGRIATAAWTTRSQNGDLDFDGTVLSSNDWPDGSSEPSDRGELHRAVRPAGDPTRGRSSRPDDGRLPTPPATSSPASTARRRRKVPTSTRSGASASSLRASPSAVPARPAWNFGSRIAGVTTDDFGGTNQYGTPDADTLRGTLTSPVLANPQLSANCRSNGGGQNGHEH